MRDLTHHETGWRVVVDSVVSNVGRALDVGGILNGGIGMWVIRTDKAAGVVSGVAAAALTLWLGGCVDSKQAVVEGQASCEEACGELVGCGLATGTQATACSARCATDPTVATRDDGAINPDCADPDDPCDCVGHASLTLDRGVALTAFPATREPDGTFERQCGAGPVDGLLIDAALLGTGRWPLDTAGVVAGSLVGFEEVASGVGDDLALELGCLERVSDNGAACGGGALDTAVRPPSFVSGPPSGPRRG